MADQTNEGQPTILVPVDFSEDSRAALIWACHQALATGGAIVVLHIVHDPANAPGYYKSKDGEALQPMEDVAAKMMRRFLKSTGPVSENKKYFKKNLTTLLVDGLPATRILEVCAAEGAGHIVMGSQGRTGLQRLLLGSKAEQIVRTAPVPVTIVKGGEAAKARKEKKEKKERKAAEKAAEKAAAKAAAKAEKAEKAAAKAEKKAAEKAAKALAEASKKSGKKADDKADEKAGADEA